MPIFVSAAVTFEIFFIIFAFFAELRRHITALSEAYVYAVILSLAVFSVSIQFFFLFEIHRFFPIVDVALILVSAGLIYRNRKLIAASWKTLTGFCLKHPFFSFSLIFISACLFIKGFLLPPTTVDSLTYHLARILMMQNDGTYFLENFNDYRQDIMPIGYDILHFLYLRFYTDYGLATFGFLSYTALLAGLFALSMRCFSNLRLSKITCFAGASLTMFLLNAASTKNDLILAAIVVACFLSANHYIKTKKWLYLFFLIIALGFGVSTKFTFGAFVIPFTVFFIYFFYQQFNFKNDVELLKIKPRYLVFAVLPVGMALLLLVLFWHNYMKYDSIMGPDAYFKLLAGPDGIGARAVNLLRYLLQVIDLPPELGGNTLTLFHDRLLGIDKSAGLFPGISTVQLSGALYTQDVFAWYGLLGLPVLLAIIITGFFAKGFIRGLALMILIYAVVISFSMPWAPWNGRFFAPVFAGGMVCFGFVLKMMAEKWPRISQWMIGCVILIAAGNLFFQVGYANFRQMPGLKQQFENRDIVYSRPFSREGWDVLVNKIPSDSKILLISATNFPVFPLLLRRPDLDFTLTGKSYAGGKFLDGAYQETLKAGGKAYDLHRIGREELEIIGQLYDKIFVLGLSSLKRGAGNGGCH